MLVTCSAMAEAERRFFAERSPEPWMDEAGRLCAAAILEVFPEAGRAEIFCGKGHNAGDALVVARWLKRQGWRLRLHFADPGGMSELTAKKLAEFEAEEERPNDLRIDSAPLVLVDGLLGLGARGELRGRMRELAARMNALRQQEGATTFAIDIPSGFDADQGLAGPDAVVADYTLSITQAKVGFAVDGAERHLGRLVEIPLDIPVEDGDATRRFLFPSHLRPRLRRRPHDLHKGGAGRLVIVAGAPGYTGAAVLSALGASRGGAGLVTLCVPEAIHAIVASKAPAETMVRPYQHFDELGALAADVYALGPGLGEEPAPGLGEFLTQQERPLVVDADALNYLARHPELLSALPANRLLTPHPGEMARLMPASRSLDRAETARRFVEKTGTTLLLKGARTLVCSAGAPLEWNTTGHPGMASGGMGDVLTGLCGAWIAQGLSLHDAACLGSWLLGRAAELAVREQGLAEESLHAPLVAEFLGKALRDLTRRRGI